MKTLNITNILKQVVPALIQRERRKWPPDCNGFFYQPKRPVEKTQADKKQPGGR